MYYIGSMAFGQDDLQHWGVLGMKWGVRKYQNYDGSLTEAGKKRYGDVGQYEYRSIGQKRKQKQVNKLEAKRQKAVSRLEKSTTDNGDGTVSIHDRRALNKVGKLNRKLATRQDQLRAYKERDRDRLNYAKSTSTGKAVLQKILGVATGGSIFFGGADVGYQRSRTRGASTAKALLTSYGSGILSTGLTVAGGIAGSVAGPAGTVAGALAGRTVGMAAHRVNTIAANKKRYGRKMWT